MPLACVLLTAEVSVTILSIIPGVQMTMYSCALWLNPVLFLYVAPSLYVSVSLLSNCYSSPNCFTETATSDIVPGEN